jgi:hypothetical protein
MKKEIKKKFDPESVPLPAIRTEIFSEPLSPYCNPQNIRPELECVLETSRQMLTALGEHSETIIIYTADKSLLLFPEVRNHRDMMAVRVMIEHFLEKFGGRAVILAFEAAIRRIDNTMKEDPNPKHTLIVEAKNLNEHLLAVQIFDEENGRFSFKPVEIMHLDEKSSVDGNWLSDLEFKDSFLDLEPVGNC